jgi:histidinol-phosphate aminotransferase
LTEDRQWVTERVLLVRQNRERLRAELGGLETDANFVFVPAPNAPDVGRRLREAGLAVRVFDDGYRVTVGPWDLMQTCIDAIGSL